jgi:G3E family GTPase
VVTLVDAVNGLATLDNHTEAVKQAAVADRIVLTKTDLPEATAERREALLRRLRRLNPSAPVLDAAAGEATADALLGAGPYDPSGKIPDVTGWLRDEALRDAAGHAGHDHGAGTEQDPHDVNRHDERIRAFALATDRPVPMAALDLFLTLLPSAHGEKLLRLKGIVCLAEQPERPVVLHAVQHVVHPPVVLPAWPDADRRTRLVFITRDLPEEFVRRLWAAFADEPAVDAPDRAALTDNPLALPRGNSP